MLDKDETVIREVKIKPVFIAMCDAACPFYGGEQAGCAKTKRRVVPRITSCSPYYEEKRLVHH